MKEFGIKQLGFTLIFLKTGKIMFQRIKEILCIPDILKPNETKKNLEINLYTDAEINLLTFKSYW